MGSGDSGIKARLAEEMRRYAIVSAPSLLHRVGWRTAGMLIVLVVLKLIEELVIGLVHGRDVQALVAELAAEPWLGLLAPVLLKLLILIPLMTAVELARVLGADELKSLFVGTRVR